ncbi:MAG TPA: SRPBCC family protein [Gemmatimonadales bacterium]|nr:SRPBCC family protein [Gemmatimonadales bacterium]
MGKTYQSIVIDAPADRVWKGIRNFHDVSWCPNAITKVEQVGDMPGDHVGAKRVLNGAFHETLQELKDEGRTFAYSITDGPSPVSKAEVSNYVGRVTVRPITQGGGTFVEWSSSWEKNDQAAHDFCHTIYCALLSEMKQSLE